MADDGVVDLAIEANIVLSSIRSVLNKSGTRTIDLFRKIDAGGDGSVDASEFRKGISGFGLDLTDDKFDAVMMVLDKDGSGDVSLKELDRAMKQAETAMDEAAKKAAKGEAKTNRKLPALDLSKSGSQSARDVAAETATEGLGMFADMRQKLSSREKRERIEMKFRRKPTELAPMDACDEVLCKIRGLLNRRKVRMIDVFRAIDVSGDGFLSPEELRNGLARIGAPCSDEDFEAIKAGLDKDNSGDVSIKEFDDALRLAEKKARSEGKTQDLDSWVIPKELLEFEAEIAEEVHDWSNYSIKQIRATNSMHSRSVLLPKTTSIMGVHTSQMSSTVNSFFASSSASAQSWCPSSAGPALFAMTAKIGSGNLQDGSVMRQKPNDFTWASHPPTTIRHQLPLHKKSMYRQAIYTGRWGAEPARLPSEKMVGSCKEDLCAFSHRSRHQPPLGGGTKKFEKTPMCMSDVDTVLFGRDFDYSGDTKFDPVFLKMYEGSHGIPSWRPERNNHASTIPLDTRASSDNL
eukprot:TRINITY_DN64747_c0_g1_i1.p1 TRINITY_DN64747_c0_g1~~TRINITY_DN64747_c0_g1_i1.p1  ORF type:complete len:539 (+),score=110.59 TRINITY_DN64747_c0_g1_i1:62-1618(+)